MKGGLGLRWALAWALYLLAWCPVSSSEKVNHPSSPKTALDCGLFPPHAMFSFLQDKDRRQPFLVLVAPPVPESVEPLKVP